MTVAEALAAETPCVVRDAGGLMNFVEEPGCTGVSEPYPRNLIDTILQAKSLPVAYDPMAWCEVTDHILEAYITS
jgi:glycosyltransferase involved in cell wall biosynthesis